MSAVEPGPPPVGVVAARCQLPRGQKEPTLVGIEWGRKGWVAHYACEDDEGSAPPQMVIPSRIDAVLCWSQLNARYKKLLIEATEESDRLMSGSTDGQSSHLGYTRTGRGTLHIVRQPGHGPHLLRLPAELRNPIYELVLASHHGANQPALLQTCRAIRSEASDIFYTDHHFRFPASSASRMDHWLKLIGDRKASAITHIMFDLEAERIRRGYSRWTCPVHITFAKSTAPDGRVRWEFKFSSPWVFQYQLDSLTCQLGYVNSLSGKVTDGRLLAELCSRVVPKKIKVTD